MNEHLDRALALSEQRAAAVVRPDYAALNKMIRRQRAALTRAKNSGDRIIETVRAAVIEWNQPGAMWPDDWAHWQRTLDDALPWHQSVNIQDLV